MENNNGYYFNVPSMTFQGVKSYMDTAHVGKEIERLSQSPSSSKAKDRILMKCKTVRQKLEFKDAISTFELKAKKEQQKMNQQLRKENNYYKTLTSNLSPEQSEHFLIEKKKVLTINQEIAALNGKIKNMEKMLEEAKAFEQMIRTQCCTRLTITSDTNGTN
jgi:hypothetical protein